MSEVQRLLIQDGDETYEILVEVEATDSNIPVTRRDETNRPGEKGGIQNLVDMEKARQTIRGYTLFVLSSFRNLMEVEIDEVNVKFGLKFSGSLGIPMITQASAEKNLEIEVKCKFPKKKEK
jgi:Trypsin-co-occurring domain 1